MPTKKQTKKTSTKIKRTMKPVTRSQKASNNDAQLRTWLFDRPIVFAVLTFLINAVVGIAYAIFANIFSITATWPLALLLVASFCWTTYYLIKKLPHDSMYRDNFIAITNGCCLISILISSITMLLISKNTTMIQYKFILLYMQYPELVWFLGALFILIYLYLLGVTISGIYAKYKRAVEIGISKWKVILSMPFAFLLMWTPGYLIPEKNQKSTLKIKSKWFAKFNNWVIADTSNTLLTFLILILLGNVFTSFPALLLTLFLLMIYTLWFVKYKISFNKNINHGYAWTAIGINVATIIVLILSFIALGANPY